ncbi:efflux RND transporter permease subunit [Fibrobacter sp.]|uniref:efflux RND transporter permease subunit n=1 Tax=Fibrobacter sp. TaxID=35828 RepID=UPI0025C6E6FD|nr:efflux RND transporter permease subunit [Fibrobacter sp.]MCI6436695.1 efflux RND transporter permease subunit [Fibrobacter sp.]MDD7498906.1 efflux RND transporter permease subunit [Fibrobacter sp.]MDY5724987.1 efflux RND transporter permease subunit [Fibrobacter sp.]
MIKASIYKPITMLMVILAIVVFGLYTYSMMVVDLMPKFDIPVVTGTIVYPGANPEEIETTIIKPIEDQVELVDGIDYVQSICMENYGIIIAMFNMGIDVDVAANDVRSKIELAAADFPDAVEAPVISKVDINASAIMSISFTGPLNSTELRQKVEDEIEPLFTSVSGVASVDIFGGTTRQISIELDKEKMIDRNVDITTIMGLYGATNVNNPVGEVIGKHKNTTVRTDGKFKTLDEMRNLDIPTSMGVIKLSEIAEIKDTVETITSASRFNGQSSISLDIKKRSDANVVEVSEGVLKRMNEINKTLPEGFELHLVYDKSESVNESIDNVIQNIMIAIALTAILLLLFLGKFSTMIIAALTMPISVIGAFTLMYFAGFGINMMSLMALSSSVGLLVTNSIVVLENINAKLGEGLDPKEAAYKGTSEIMVAIMASTLTNVCVFVPIAFMKSIVGIFFRTFGMTMVFATVVSLIITFTLTPLMAAYLFKGKKKDENGNIIESKPSIGERIFGVFPTVLNGIRFVYLKTLSFCLSVPGVIFQVLALVAMLMFVGYMTTNKMTVELSPKQDQGMMSVKLEMPVGTNIETTDSVARIIESRIKDVPEIVHYSVTVGGSNGMTSVNQASLRIKLLKDREGRTRSTDQIVDSLRPYFANIPDAYISIKSTSASEMNNSSGGDVVLEVSGLKMDSVVKASQIVMDRIKDKIDGIVDVKTSYEAGKPEIRLIPNRQALADYGVTLKTVATYNYIAVSGYEAGQYSEDGEEYDVYVRLQEKDRQSHSDIETLPILTPKGYVNTSELFYVEDGAGPTRIDRKRKLSRIDISMNLLPGHTTGEIMGKLGKLTSEMEDEIPEGVSFGFGGNADMQNDMVQEFITAIIMAILLTYILLVALLESFAQPFIIMTTIPMGAIGVFLALIFTGKALSMISLMAIVMLIGVVVNNAILLLDEANRLLRSGAMGRRSAVMTAAKTKFQPIVLATFASVVAQLPLAFALGGDVAAMTQPMGIASVGGLIVSALLTMYLVPTFFWLPNAITSKVKSKANKIIAKRRRSKE